MMIAEPSQKPQKDSRSVREKTYEQLKAEIFAGRFRPGERLAEEHLAEKLGVSRTPVREALHKLEQDGLIEPLESRGFCIPHDSREEMEELFHLRMVLEGYALSMICERIADEQIRSLEEMVDESDEALQRGRLDEVFHWNPRLHDALHEMIADKRRFHSLIVNMRKYVLRYRKDTLQYLDAGRRTIEGHRQLLSALKMREPDLCERVMRIHIRQSMADALETKKTKTGKD